MICKVKKKQNKDLENSQPIHIAKNKNMKGVAKWPIDGQEDSQGSAISTEARDYSPKQWKNNSESDSEITRAATPFTALRVRTGDRGGGQSGFRGGAAGAYRTLVRAILCCLMSQASTFKTSACVLFYFYLFASILPSNETVGFLRAGTRHPSG